MITSHKEIIKKNVHETNAGYEHIMEPGWKFWR
jgi:hypothetical protein